MTGARSPGISHHDHLRLRAGHYWNAGKPLPAALFQELIQAGLTPDIELARHVQSRTNEEQTTHG